jgi:phosphatidylserine/phosphatidylglycerophosphate/cardiolipin synthase-like enzyme
VGILDSIAHAWRPGRLAGRVTPLTLAALLALAGCGSEGDMVSAGPDVTDPNDPGDPDNPDGGEPLPAGSPSPSASPWPSPVVSPSPAASPQPSPSPSPPPQSTELRRLCFSPNEDCVQRMLSYLDAEKEGVDVAIYHLYDGRIRQRLIAKHQAGIPVRVIADRHAYGQKPQHAREMNALASAGVPVLTNRHNGIIHHKVMLLHGQRLVVHGSMNFTSVASRKVVFNGVTTWNEEIAFFTTNDQVFARFRERFDRMWGNVGPGTETFQRFTAGMRLPPLTAAATTCYENPLPDPRPLEDDPELRVCFAPDERCNQDLIASVIRREASARLDMFVFRITVDSVGNPIKEKIEAGIPVRLIIERSQYANPAYPSMTRILNQLWELNTRGNLQIKATNHAGSMHMKSVITPSVATWSSGNFTNPSSASGVRGCQTRYYQDEDTMVATDPELVNAMQARFDQLWNSSDVADFVPASPVPSPLPAATPTPSPGADDDA